MSAYSEQQFEMMRSSYVMQFGEEGGEKLFELQKRVMELIEQGTDEENMQRVREAQAEFNAAFGELNAMITAKSYEENEDDDDISPRYNGLIDKDDIDDFDDDDDDYYYLDDDEPEVKTEYEKLLILYSEVFGAENGALLAKYMSRMSEITNDEGLNDSNRAEHEELKAKYQELLDSLGGQQRIIEYSMNAYKNADSNSDDDDFDDDDDDYDDDDDDDESAAGIDALDAVIEKLYGEQEGFSFGTVVPSYLGGNDPIDLVRAFESESGGVPHWHYITYGFTELYDKESDDKEVSGFGFELTFRLKKNEIEPPIWPVNLLQNIARYVFKTGNVFAPGHHMNANGPIQLDYDTDITALGFISDPELPEIDTENGSVEFVEMVGITADEMEAVMCWDCKKLLKLFDEFIPFGITDLDRKSFMGIEKIQKAFKAGVETDGSSTSYIYTDFAAVSLTENGKTTVYGNDITDEELSAKKEDGIPTIYFGAGHIERIILMLRGRLLKDNSFSIIVKNEKRTNLFFSIGDECEVSTDDEDIDIILTREAIEEITKKLQPKAGEYMLQSGNINFKITKTNIRDSQGNIIETIG